MRSAVPAGTSTGTATGCSSDETVDQEILISELKEARFAAQMGETDMERSLGRARVRRLQERLSITAAGQSSTNCSPHPGRGAAPETCGTPNTFSRQVRAGWGVSELSREDVSPSCAGIVDRLTEIKAAIATSCAAPLVARCLPMAMPLGGHSNGHRPDQPKGLHEEAAAAMAAGGGGSPTVL